MKKSRNQNNSKQCCSVNSCYGKKAKKKFNISEVDFNVSKQNKAQTLEENPYNLNDNFANVQQEKQQRNSSTDKSLQYESKFQKHGAPASGRGLKSTIMSKAELNKHAGISSKDGVIPNEFYHGEEKPREHLYSPRTEEKKEDQHLPKYKDIIKPNHIKNKDSFANSDYEIEMQQSFIDNNKNSISERLSRNAVFYKKASNRFSSNTIVFKQDSRDKVVDDNKKFYSYNNNFHQSDNNIESCNVSFVTYAEKGTNTDPVIIASVDKPNKIKQFNINKKPSNINENTKISFVSKIERSPEGKERSGRNKTFQFPT